MLGKLKSGKLFGMLRLPSHPLPAAPDPLKVAGLFYFRTV
jgi:hypothetical protein